MKKMNIFNTLRHFLNVLLLLLLLVGVNTTAWGKHFYAKCEVKSQPSQGGFVYVSQSPKEDDSYSFVNLTTDITETKESGYHTSWASSTNLDFCGYQKANSGYSFRGWSTNKNATSGMTDQKDHKYNYKAFSGAYQVFLSVLYLKSVHFQAPPSSGERGTL